MKLMKPDSIYHMDTFLYKSEGGNLLYRTIGDSGWNVATFNPIYFYHQYQYKLKELTEEELFLEMI